MRREFLARVAVIGLLSVMLESQGLVFAQAVHEPTIDERFRDENVKPAAAEMPRLDPPQNSQSRLMPAKPGAAKSSAAAYLGVTFSGNERDAIVRTVAPSSPAEQAGLKPNDLIETLQGRRIRTNDDVLDIVSKMRPGDVLDIGFTRRMNIRTQAPLAVLPATTERSVGYPPDSQPTNIAAPEDPEDTKQKAPQSNRNSTPQNGKQSSNTQRRNDNSKSSQSDDNRRLLDRGLRGR
jgi:membrane-associated protease RseP (regulator of RpoE activity)